MSFLRSDVWNRRPFRTVVVPVMCGLVFAASLASIAAVMPNASNNNPAAAPARALSQSFREAVKAVQPAVVMIKSEAGMPVKLNNQAPGDDDSLGPFGNMPELRKFFKNMPQTPHRGESGLGSGLIIDASGVVLTNAHVVRDGSRITVRLLDGREYKASKVHSDPNTDLAVLRIEGADHLTAAKLGNSDEAEVGDWVLALGNPFGLEGTVTAGIVSAKGRGIGLSERENFIQTDAAINPGNSGGPLVNLDGEVVGINRMIFSNSGAYQGVGFAIPINVAKWVGGQLLTAGKVHRAYLGVSLQEVNQSLAEQFKVKVNQGVLISQVFPNTPAAKAGLKAGDVILEFDGKTIASPHELQGLVEMAKPGATAPLTIIRDGTRMTLGVKSAEMPSDYGVAGTSSQGAGDENEKAETSRFEKLGVEVEDLTPALAEQLGVKEEHGVAITSVRSGSPAELAGLAAGMVITEANHQPVKTVADFRKALGNKSLDKGILLHVRSQEGSRFIVIRVESD